MNLFKEEITGSGASEEQSVFEKLKAFRDIGEKFNYLGVEMIVTGHVRMTVAGQGTFPMLSADYVTNDGIVQNIEFTIDKLPVLMAENPTNQSQP